MSKQYKRKETKHTLNRALLAVLSFLITLTVAVSSVAVLEHFTDLGWRDSVTVSSESDSSDIVIQPQKTVRLSTATVSVTGDLLMHSPIMTAAKQSDGSYDFDNIFTYFESYVSAADYAVANLETTLCSDSEGYKYSGYPQFNCPDEIVDAAAKAGFDMLLTANNHSYDTRIKGMLRTLEVIDGKKLDRLGTHKDTEEKRYAVKQINGINIGMMCYTYETDKSSDGVALNGIQMSTEAAKLVNAFSYNELDTFYQSVADNISSMKSDGVEAVVLFIHWGDEYNLSANSDQKAMAAEMCNLGVDVIVGGHPHVVEPVELLQSELDENHKTVCIYSVGNAVSNQRKTAVNMKTGHTEDGVLFSFTFAKYSDGTVRLEGVELLPTWVNLYTSKDTGKKVYEILPLDDSVENWQETFKLSETTEKSARASLERTEKIVGDGMKEVKEYLDSLPEIAESN